MHSKLNIDVIVSEVTYLNHFYDNKKSKQYYIKSSIHIIIHHSFFIEV